MTDDKPESNKPAKEDLLNELQSIKGLLDETPAKNKLPENLDIPTLDDIVEGSALGQAENNTVTEDTPEQENTFAEDADLLDLASIFDEPGFDHSETEETQKTAATEDLLDSSFNFELDDLELDELSLDSSETEIETDSGKTEGDISPDDSPELTTAFNLDDLDTNVDIPNFKLSTELSADNQTISNGEDDDLLIDDELGDGLDDDLYNESNLALDSDLDKEDDQALIDQRLQADYEEEQNDLFSATAESTLSEHKTVGSSSTLKNDAIADVNIDLLIQEIVDEFIPVLEDELRQKLSYHSPEVIRQLAKKYLDK